MTPSKRVLVVASSAPLLDLRLAALAGLDEVELVGVTSASAAKEHIDHSPPHILLTEAELEDGRGTELIAQLERRGARTTALVIGLDAGSDQATSDYIVNTLNADISSEALNVLVAQELESFEGQVPVDPFGVGDYLQLASFNRRSLSLDVLLVDGRRGEISIVDGEAWSAELPADALRGVEALSELVGHSAATIAVRELAQRPRAREITIPTHALLLDLARLQDEARRAEAPEVSGVFQRPSDWELELDEEELELESELAPEANPIESSAARADERAAPEQGDGPAAAARAWINAYARGERAPAQASALPPTLEARRWPAALREPRPTAVPDPRVHLVGFDPDYAEVLRARLSELGLDSVASSVEQLASSATAPRLLVQKLEVEDQGPPFACFDLAWTLHASGRRCPWMVVTDWPTRYTRPLCTQLGASAWHDLGFLDEHEVELAPAIAGLFQGGAEPPPMSEHASLLGLILMLVDAGVDATLAIRDGAGELSGRVALSEGELHAAEARRGEASASSRGLEAAAQLCRIEQLEIEIGAPIPTRERNLPRGLALALAALTRELPGPTTTPTRGAAQEQVRHMSRINTVCEELVNDIPDALACGVIDLNTGMLMGIHHTISYFTQSYLDAVAAAAVDMFRGRNVQRIEKLISKHRGEEIRDSFEEIFVSSKAVFHFMKLVPEKSAVVVLVTRKSTNQGMGWSALRIALDDIRDALP